jgi:hypothetical protein
LYVVVGKEVLYSDPFDYHRYAPLTNRIPFKTEVVVCQSVEAGLIIGTTDRLYLFRGNDPTTFDVEVLHDGQVLGATGHSDGTYVSTNYGLAFVSKTGEFTYLHRDTVALPDAVSATTSIVERDGARAVLVGLNSASASSMAARSYMDARVLKGA